MKCRPAPAPRRLVGGGTEKNKKKDPNGRGFCLKNAGIYS